MSARELRASDLQQLTPHQFEQLTYLLARAEDEQTVIVRNHDRGLDARRPDPMGRLTLRGWQAKRFVTAEVQWSQCEASVKTALAFCWLVPAESTSSCTLAGPCRSRSRILMRVGSPITRNRPASSSTSGSGIGSGSAPSVGSDRRTPVTLCGAPRLVTGGRRG